MQPIKPHWGWFLAGPAVMVLGGIAAFVILFAGAMNVSSGMQRVSAPGDGTINIAEAGESTIFFEQTGVSQVSIPPDLKVDIYPEGKDQPLPLTTGAGSFTYNNGNVAGRNYKTVNFPQAGKYRVKVNSSVPGEVALGGNPAGALVGTLGGFFGVGAASFVLGVIILIVVAMKRAGYRKRMNQQMYPPPSGGMSPPPPGAAIR